MIQEEAKTWLECIEFEVPIKTQKALIVAIKALEKEISKNIIRETRQEDTTLALPYIYHRCPNCGTGNIEIYDAFCRDCGQKLDWTEPVKSYPSYLDLPKT